MFYAFWIKNYFSKLIMLWKYSVFYTEDTNIFSFNMFSKKSSELFETNHKIARTDYNDNSDIFVAITSEKVLIWKLRSK